tara:strand:- start:16810 stop:17793 length:984 start_codon:yes stop_codon:yes gene_type:complete
MDEGWPDVDLIKAAHINNSHGFGLMYLNEDRRVVAEKILPNSYDDIEEVLSKHPTDVEAGYHFRLNTHGETAAEMSHPFKVLDYDKHGRDLFLMHNGPRLPVRIEDNTKSDTWHFVENILRPILVADPDLIEDAEFVRLMDRIVGSDKLLFLDSEKGFIRVNEKAGTEKAGMWLSNTYSLNRSKGMNYNVHTGIVQPATPPALPPMIQHGKYQGYKGHNYKGHNYAKEYAARNNNGSWGEAYDEFDDDFYWDSATKSTKAEVKQLRVVEKEKVEPSIMSLLTQNVDPVETEDVVSAYCEGTLYEFALDNMEGLVGWLKEMIALPKAS